MNKKEALLIVIALVLLFSGIVLATSSLDVEIYAFDQNPAGRDKGNEWATFYNPSNQSVDHHLLPLYIISVYAVLGDPVRDEPR